MDTRRSNYLAVVNSATVNTDVQTSLSRLTWSPLVKYGEWMVNGYMVDLVLVFEGNLALLQIG